MADVAVVRVHELLVTEQCLRHHVLSPTRS